MSTQQLARIFDEDLWRSERPGRQERFDAERFGLWLEVMLGGRHGPGSPPPPCPSSTSSRRRRC